MPAKAEEACLMRNALFQKTVNLLRKPDEKAVKLLTVAEDDLQKPVIPMKNKLSSLQTLEFKCLSMITKINMDGHFNNRKGTTSVPRILA